MDVGWLRDDALGQLIAWLDVVPNPKAVMLGGQMDPLAGFSQAVGNIKRLPAEVPGTALLRADPAAFGALAHGAVFTGGVPWRDPVENWHSCHGGEGGPAATLSA